MLGIMGNPAGIGWFCISSFDYWRVTAWKRQGRTFFFRRTKLGCHNKGSGRRILSMTVSVHGCKPMEESSLDLIYNFKQLTNFIVPWSWKWGWNRTTCFRFHISLKTISIESCSTLKPLFNSIQIPNHQTRPMDVAQRGGHDMTNGKVRCRDVRLGCGTKNRGSYHFQEKSKETLMISLWQFHIAREKGLFTLRWLPLYSGDSP